MIASRVLRRRHRIPTASGHCGGSLASVPSRRVVHDGKTACPTCRCHVDIVQHPDGGPAPFVAEHERRPL